MRLLLWPALCTPQILILENFIPVYGCRSRSVRSGMLPDHYFGNKYVLCCSIIGESLHGMLQCDLIAGPAVCRTIGTALLCICSYTNHVQVWYIIPPHQHFEFLRPCRGHTHVQTCICTRMHVPAKLVIPIGHGNSSCVYLENDHKVKNKTTNQLHNKPFFPVLSSLRKLFLSDKYSFVNSVYASMAVAPPAHHHHHLHSSFIFSFFVLLLEKQEPSETNRTLYLAAVYLVVIGDETKPWSSERTTRSHVLF